MLTLVVPPRPVACTHPQAVLSMDELMQKYRLPRAAASPEPAEPQATPAMLAAAAASDMREAFPCFYDEEADRPAPVLCGHTDLALAIEG